MTCAPNFFSNGFSTVSSTICWYSPPWVLTTSVSAAIAGITNGDAIALAPTAAPPATTWRRLSLVAGKGVLAFDISPLLESTERQPFGRVGPRGAARRIGPGGSLSCQSPSRHDGYAPGLLSNERSEFDTREQAVAAVPRVRQQESDGDHHVPCKSSSSAKWHAAAL